MAVLMKLLLLSCVISLAAADHGHHGHDHHDHSEDPKPYRFGYEISDHYSKQHRHESQDEHGNVKGSYGYVDAHGVHRVVHYTADGHGFRAEIKTNEKGTSNQDPAYVHIDSAYHPHHEDHDHH